MNETQYFEVLNSVTKQLVKAGVTDLAIHPYYCDPYEPYTPESGPQIPEPGQAFIRIIIGMDSIMYIPRDKQYDWNMRSESEHKWFEENNLNPSQIALEKFCYDLFGDAIKDAARIKDLVYVEGDDFNEFDVLQFDVEWDV